MGPAQPGLQLVYIKCITIKAFRKEIKLKSDKEAQIFLGKKHIK